MFGLSIEVDFDGEAPRKGDPVSPPSASATLFEALTEWWIHNAAEPYLSLNRYERLSTISVEWHFLENQTELNITFDYDLLESLLEIYAAYGWNPLDKIEKVLKQLPNAQEATKEFYRLTRNIVAVMVAQGLVDVETQVITYARRQWESTRSRLEVHLRAFKNIGVNVENYTLINRKLADDLFLLCREYGKAAREAQRLQGKMEQRNRVSPPQTRRKGSGADLWFEVFAAPQREILKKLVEYLKLIAGKFPAAILILNDLPESVISADSLIDTALAKGALENAIAMTLKGIISDLQLLEKSLSSPSATSPVADFLKSMNTPSRDFSALWHLSVPEGGFTQKVIADVFERTGEGEQRVLVNVDLLVNFLHDPEGIEPGTWNQVVLYQYCERLIEVVEAEKKSEEFWVNFWSWLRRLTAFLALVGLMAIFPFGDAAVAPALASLLMISGTISVILGVLTMLYDLFDALQKAGKLEANAQDNFFRLVQNDPEAILEIGELLSRSKALREGVANGLLSTVLTLGAARALKPLAAALNFRDFFQDIETLFSPVEANG